MMRKIISPNSFTLSEVMQNTSSLFPPLHSKNNFMQQLFQHASLHIFDLSARTNERLNTEYFDKKVQHYAPSFGV